MTSAPAKDPVITVDLGSSEPTSGDFKIQGYSSKMNLMNIVIRTADCTYYFDEYNMTEEMTSVIPATGDSGSYAVFMLFLLSAVTATAALLRLKKKS